MTKHLASSVLAVMVLCILAMPAFSASTVFDHTWNFDSSDNPLNPAVFKFDASGASQGTMPSVWTSQDLSVTDGLLGVFGNSSNSLVAPLATVARGVYLTIGTPGGPAFSAVTISFQLWALNTWDGNDSTFGPDHFQVGISSGPAASFNKPPSACGVGPGSTSLFCPTLANGDAVGSLDPSSQLTGDNAGFFVSPGLPQRGIAAGGVSIFDISLTNVPVTPVNGQVTIWFAGWQDQATLNESWALSSLRTTALSDVTNGGGNGGGGNGGGDPVIPEPSTLALGGLGLALLAFARRKTTKA